MPDDKPAVKNVYLPNIEGLVSQDVRLKLAIKEFEEYRGELRKKYRGGYPKAVQQEFTERKAAIQTLRIEIQKEIQKQRAEVFLQEFLNNGGNATQAVMKIFGVKDQGVALNLGHRMMKQSSLLSRGLLDKKGITYGKFLDIAIDKMNASKDTDWWDRLMKIGGYQDFLPHKTGPQPQVVNIIGSQKNLQSEYGFGEAVEGEEAKDAEEEL